MATPTQQRPEAGPPGHPIDTGRMMRAVVHDRYGTDPAQVLRLATVRSPMMAEDQVLVRVHAASVDRGTWHIMSGLPYPIRLAGFGVRTPNQLNPGRSLAGHIEAVGGNVSTLAVGDEVFGMCDGSFAEYACASPSTLAAKPAALSFAQAAAVPVSGVTALQAVRDHGRVRPGDDVLVLGAAGGVGSFAVQIAKSCGAKVTGVSRTDNLRHVASLGADRVIDHTTSSFADDGHRYDVILDIGGNSRLAQLRRALTPRGTLVIVGGETDGRLLGGSGRTVRALMLSPFVGQRLGSFVASENAADLATLAGLIEDGQVFPAIDRTYPLAEAPAAITHLVSGSARGKTVVAV
jgi:NADPH:quinone reductase-like Zn-dependent oxidoreductase